MHAIHADAEEEGADAESKEKGVYAVYADDELVSEILSVALSCHPSTMPETSALEWYVWACEDINSADG